jgi:hypothetical protein
MAARLGRVEYNTGRQVMRLEQGSTRFGHFDDADFVLVKNVTEAGVVGQWPSAYDANRLQRSIVAEESVIRQYPPTRRYLLR